MSQKLKAETSSNQSSNIQHIKPKLAAALASLEVQLDQELARYRRTRLSERKPNQKQFWKFATNQSAQPSSEKISSEKINSEQLHSEQSNSVTAGLDSTSPAYKGNLPREELTVESKDSINQIKTKTPVPAQSQVNSKVSNTSKVTREQTEIYPAKDKKKSNQLNLETAANSGSIVPKENPKQKQAEVFPGEQTVIQSPEDYLESSEELLRSFSAEQKSTKKPQAKTDILFTPLGIASMFLLLVSCILVGWAAANPGELPKLSFGRLFKKNSNDNLNIPASSSRSITQPQITSIPKKPNLATREFPDVKNPDDVVNLKPKAKSTTAASTQPLSSPRNKLKIQENISQASGNINSTTSIKTPKIIEETQQNQSDADIKPSADGLYHVVVNNEGAASLTQAQQVVPDAYVSDDGKLIYLGALKTKERAEKLLSELKAKGLDAKIE